MMKSHINFLFIFILIFSISCQKSGPQDQEPSVKIVSENVPTSTTQNQPAFQPFYIYTNKGSSLNHYVPSGFMPNGQCIKLSDGFGESCYSEKTCLRIEYDLECSRNDQKWAGIYWLNPANNWGTKKGGYNLSGAKRLTFWARGDKGGEQIKEFTIGGISGDFPDSASVSIGPVILTNQWRQYSIDLRGNDLSYISGGFAWSTSENVNVDSCVFYLDEIRYE